MPYAIGGALGCAVCFPTMFCTAAGTAAHSCCCSVREGFAPFSQIGVSL